MKKIILFATMFLALQMFGAYSIGSTVTLGDNITWTDNYGYSSSIFAEVLKGKPVMIFFGQTW